VRLSHPLERDEDMNLPAVGGESTEDGSVGGRIAKRCEDPVETLVADDHRRLIVGCLVEREPAPRHGPRGEAGSSVSIEACIDDRFGLQNRRFVREHLTSLSYISVVHGLASASVIPSLLPTDRFRSMTAP